MSEKYKFMVPDGIYFTTTTLVQWVDLFTKKRYSDIVLESLEHCQSDKGLTIHAWCLMSSHLHLIVSTHKEPLYDIFRDFKKFTAKRIFNEVKNGTDSRKGWLIPIFRQAAEPLKRIQNFKVWQDGNHPVLLDNNHMLDQRLNYVHNNPVKQGIVSDPTHYLLSSARDYAGEKGLLDVELIQ